MSESQNPAKATIAIERVGKDEMNLAEFPVSILTNKQINKKDQQRVKTLEFHDEHGKLIITGSDKFGLPTALDIDVLIGLIELTKKRNNFAKVTVNFTRYELIRLMEWQNVGSSYDRIEESLNRWAGIMLVYDGNFWDNRLRTYTKKTFHIIDTHTIADGKSLTIEDGRQEMLPLSSFTWSKQFIQSCQDNNIKDLDTEYYYSLELPTTKQLFRFLDKRFYSRSKWIFDLEEIGFERVGLSRKYNASKIKEKLAPAIAELENTKYLKILSHDQRYIKTSEGWKIVFVRGTRRMKTEKEKSTQPIAAETSPPPKHETAPSDLDTKSLALIDELVKRGVTASAAKKMVQQFPADSIQEKIDVFDWMVDRQDKRLAKSPAGYLVKSINDNYAQPKGFTSKAEQERQQEANAARERLAAEQRHRKQKQDAAERAEHQEILKYWDKLTPEQQAELQATADAQSDPDKLANEVMPALKSFGQMIRRQDYIRQLLRNRQTEDA